MSDLGFALLLGFAAAGVSCALRVLLSDLSDLQMIGVSRGATWLLFHKPVSCDLCMAIWTALGLAFYLPAPHVLGYFAGVMVATLALTVFKKLT